MKRVPTIENQTLFKSGFPDVTLGMMSWKAPLTVAHTLSSYKSADILDLFAERLIHFNEVSPSDREIAQVYGFAASASDTNLGIFGAMEALAARVKTPYFLSVENDCPLVTDRAGLAAMVRTAVADMRAMDVPVFSMRSRRLPGEKFVRRSRYEKYFRVIAPIGTALAQRRGRTPVVQALWEDLRRSPLRGAAIYAEEDPTLRHPSVIQKTTNGNWVTTSSFLTWSNCCFLVRTDFLRDILLDRVRRYPAKTTLNGTQDIEAAMKVDHWWRRQAYPIGQSEPGAFTHVRLDR